MASSLRLVHFVSLVYEIEPDHSHKPGEPEKSHLTRLGRTVRRADFQHSSLNSRRILGSIGETAKLGSILVLRDNLTRSRQERNVRREK
jgi:hypothetical protein